MGRTGDKGRLEDDGQLQINDDDDHRQDDDHSDDDRQDDDDRGNDDGADDEEKDLDDNDSVGEMLNVQTCSIVHSPNLRSLREYIKKKVIVIMSSVHIKMYQMFSFCRQCMRTWKGWSHHLEL